MIDEVGVAAMLPASRGLHGTCTTTPPDPRAYAVNDPR